MPTARPSRKIRFGIAGGMAADRRGLIDAALAAENAGFSTFGVSDHFMVPLSPLISLQAVADATTRLRLTMNVLDQDFRHPAILAKDLASLDVLSGGRVEVGIGAGWMTADYEQSGIPFDSASVRIERLEEVVIILKGLFAGSSFSFSGRHFTITEMTGLPQPLQHPRPPIMVGGGGRKLLSVAARQADIVAIAATNRKGSMSIDPSEFTVKSLDEKVGWIREAAGDRIDDLELNGLLMGVTITNDRRSAVRQAVEMFRAMAASAGGQSNFSDEDVETSPNFAIGTVDEVCEKLLGLRERYGISYFTVFGAVPEVIPELVEKLEGV